MNSMQQGKLFLRGKHHESCKGISYFYYRAHQKVPEGLGISSYDLFNCHKCNSSLTEDSVAKFFFDKLGNSFFEEKNSVQNKRKDNSLIFED